MHYLKNNLCFYSRSEDWSCGPIEVGGHNASYCSSHSSSNKGSSHMSKQMSVDRLESPASPPKSKKNFFDGFRNTLRPRLKPDGRAHSDVSAATCDSDGFLSPNKDFMDDPNVWQMVI